MVKYFNQFYFAELPHPATPTPTHKKNMTDFLHVDPHAHATYGDDGHINFCLGAMLHPCYTHIITDFLDLKAMSTLHI